MAAAAAADADIVPAAAVVATAPAQPQQGAGRAKRHAAESAAAALKRPALVVSFAHSHLHRKRAEQRPAKARTKLAAKRGSARAAAPESAATPKIHTKPSNSTKAKPRPKAKRKESILADDGQAIHAVLDELGKRDSAAAAAETFLVPLSALLAEGATPQQAGAAHAGVDAMLRGAMRNAVRIARGTSLPALKRSLRATTFN